MSRLISFVLSDLRCQPREESENYKMKNSCPQQDLNPLSLALKTGALIDHAGRTSVCIRVYVNDIHMPYYKFKQVQPKTRNKILFKIHFIIYRDLNITVFSKRFPPMIYI